jgi:hypothetical protein
MTYNVLKLCEDKGDYFEVDPAVMFPATIARIKEVLAGEPPIEIVSIGWTGRADREPVADKFVRQAEALPAAAFDLALQPFSDFPELDPKKPDKELKAKLDYRAAALGLAESWFKRALALATGRGIRIHISRNPDYRRV